MSTVQEVKIKNLYVKSIIACADILSVHLGDYTKIKFRCFAFHVLLQIINTKNDIFDYLLELFLWYSRMIVYIQRLKYK